MSIQLSHNEAVFAKSVQLFFDKYSDESLREFCTSLRSGWINTDSIRQHLIDLELGASTSFDEWIEKTNSIRVVRINTSTWELSECSCSYWQKNFKCNHVIAIAARLNLCNFATIALLLPLERKRKPGRKKATKPCLQRQSVDPTNVGKPPPIIDDKDDQEEPAPEKTKKANKRKTATTEQRSSKRLRND